MPRNPILTTVKVKTYKVRCLGRGREHTFQSTDPRTNRICPRCERLNRSDASARDVPMRANLSWE